MNKIYFLFCVSKMTKASCFLLVLFFLISVSSYSQTITFAPTSTTAGTFKIPAGVTSLSVECWGAGGAGGGAKAVISVFGAGGGGGGAYSKVASFAVTPATILSYQVGAGGIGVNGADGGNGNSTYFSTVTANGGLGGEKGNTSNGIGGIGGTAGAGTSFSGGTGGTPGLVGGILSSGGGGGSAGTDSNGNNGVLGTGGAAVTNGSAGSAGVLLAGNGIDNIAVGGGGGGAKGLLLSDYKGGDGGNGKLNIIYSCPGYNFTGISAPDVCLTSGTTSLVKLTGGSLPVGDYVVTYNTSNPSATLIANATVSVAGTLEFTATGLNTAGSSTITVTKLTSESCFNDFLSANTVTITVKPLPVAAGTITGTSTVCQGQSGVVYSVSAITNATSYSWSYSGTGASITNGTTATPIIVFALNATSGNLTVYGVNSCGNGTISASYPITVNSLPFTPTVGLITQPTCALPKGSVALNGLPVSGTWTINPGNYNGTGTSTTIPNLAVGTYNFTVSNESCTSLATANVVINAIATKTWNGSWSGFAPTIEENVVFATDYNNANVLNENIDIEACSCQVESGAHVTFKTGHYLKLRNELLVDANGSLTFENDASLVQMNNGSVNSGNIVYKRYTKPVKRYDFTYWSSPVEGQTLKNLSPNTLYDKYYSYNPTTGWVIHYSGDKEMSPGEGYIIRAPQTFSITSATIDYNPQFEGKPNNGEIKRDLTGGKVYLLGNPYPSAISADAFLTQNAGKLGGTLYFWTHNSPPSIKVDGDATYNYTTNDYATYNLTGGVAIHAAIVDSDTNDPNDNNNLEVPSGNIAAAQGFFAPASATGGEIVFNNEMRLLDGEEMDDGEAYDEVRDNSQFFKLGTTLKSVSVVEKNRLWLNLANAQGAFKQTLIGYITGATNDYEGSFDGVSYDGNQYVDFYSVNQDMNLSIQGRALPFHKKDSVLLGYKSAIVGEFKISVGYADGKLKSQTVFLEDKLLQVLHDLTKSAYTFSTEIGRFNNRFVLKYVDKNAVEEIPEPEIPEVLNKEVLISVKQGVITINSPVELLEKVVLYDTAGRKIYQKNKVGANILSIEHLVSSHQVVLISISLSDKSKLMRKIIYNTI